MPPPNLAATGTGAAGAWKLAKRCSTSATTLRVIHRAGGDHEHVGRAIIAREICPQIVGLEAGHALARAEDGPADRLVGERLFLQIIEHEIARIVLRGADLLHDHILLALELGRIERWVAENVGEHVERERHVGFEHARVIGRRFDRGRGVEVAADRLDLLRDLPRGAALRALERHVLEKMRDAVFLLLLVAAAGADPDAERGGLEMRHGVGHHRETGRKTGQFDTHAAAPPRAARLAASTKRSIWP